MSTGRNGVGHNKVSDLRSYLLYWWPFRISVLCGIVNSFADIDSLLPCVCGVWFIIVLRD